ncbi:MAG: hypothetical protein Q8934_10735 [Bacillota bacterium]|nr:hypothetical protein [Bacillota bacterium]
MKIATYLRVGTKGGQEEWQNSFQKQSTVISDRAKELGYTVVERSPDNFESSENIDNTDVLARVIKRGFFCLLPHQK